MRSVKVTLFFSLLPLPLLSAAAPPVPGGAPTVKPEGRLAVEAVALLEKRCLQCHGGDRISGLDLRTRAAARAGGKRGPGFVPGKPEESRLLLAVQHKTDFPMPPAGALPAAEQDLLRRWMAAGAPWPAIPSQGGRSQSAKAGPSAPNAVSGAAFWSLRPVRRPTMPGVKNKAWVRNPIDTFVLAKLEAQGLAPAPAADRRTLMRRLYFDLIGLPPAPEEVERFVADRRPDAYERLVDALLADPRYGERWARHWLDVARFAESQGFERDKIREHSWRYRDYVIQSFNRDKPYDRFVKEQVAGDLLPDATAESVVGTGFLVAGPWDEVGHTQASQVMRMRVREDELEDMVSVTGQTFLGLTVNCARCHDHKFDPIPQKDYYRFQAALAGVRHGDRPALPPAEMKRRETETQTLRARLRELEAGKGQIESAARRRALARVRAEHREKTAATPLPRPALAWSFENGLNDEIRGLPLELKGGASLAGGRLRLDGKDGRATSPALPFPLGAKTLEVWLSLGKLDQGGGSALTVEDLTGNLFDGIVYGERQPRKWIAGSSFYARTRDLDAAPEDTGTDELVHVAITYDPQGRIGVYRNGREYGAGYSPAATAGSGLHIFLQGGARVLFGLRHSAVAGRDGRHWLAGEIEEARVYDRALSPEELRATFEHGPPVVTEGEVQAAMTEAEAKEFERLDRETGDLKKRVTALTSPPLAYAANVLEPGPVHRLERGDIGKKAELVTPAGLSCVRTPPAEFRLPADAPDALRRLRLAEWIASPANPLTARVMVNRVWQYHFGQGIVSTPSDFGVMGDRPSHPELLDWLASVFSSSGTAHVAAGARGRGAGAGGGTRPLPGRKAAGSQYANNTQNPTSNASPPGLGWSLKRLHRLIVTSNTYRQSARHNPRAAAVDAENRLLWRITPRRLEAEEIRDASLAISKRLNPEMGGPGFRPFTITVSNSHFYTYEDREGADYERRSIYRTIVNSGGIPLLETFDCPDPSVKAPRRSATTTPLQALSLLNNSFMLRQAADAGKRVLLEAGPDPARQADRAYRLFLARPPRPDEAARAAAFIKEHGSAALCRVLFNSSEFLFVQ